MVSNVGRPPLSRRLSFYLGGTLPKEYDSWTEKRLSSRWPFLVQHVLGSTVLLACGLIPLSLLLGLSRVDALRVFSMSTAGIVLFSILLSERFRRYSIKRHGLRFEPE